MQLKTKTNEQKEKEREREREKQKKHRLLTTESKLRVTRGKVSGDGLNRCWVLRRAHVLMSTGCCMGVLNHFIVHLRLVLHCMLANWNLNKI